jgi:hypothetical protein
LNGKVLQISTPPPLGPQRSMKFQQREWFDDAVMKHYCNGQIIKKVVPNSGNTLNLWDVKHPTILLLIQKFGNLAKSNSTHAWVYNLCDYTTVYAGPGF